MEKSKFSTHNTEWLGSKIDENGTTSLAHKSNAIRNLKWVQLTNVKIYPNFSILIHTDQRAYAKKRFELSDTHLSAFENMEKEICNTVTNHHFDVKLKTREIATYLT